MPPPLPATTPGAGAMKEATPPSKRPSAPARPDSIRTRKRAGPTSIPASTCSINRSSVLTVGPSAARSVLHESITANAIAPRIREDAWNQRRIILSTAFASSSNSSCAADPGANSRTVSPVTTASAITTRWPIAGSDFPAHVVQRAKWRVRGPAWCCTEISRAQSECAASSSAARRGL